MWSFGYNPERDIYLDYLGDFVKKFPKRYETKTLSVS